jgi:hypothetical protein
MYTVEKNVDFSGTSFSFEKAPFSGRAGCHQTGPSNATEAAEVAAASFRAGERRRIINVYIGQLEPGFLADIVFLEISHINYFPFRNLLLQMVFAENGAAVDSVMVGGRPKGGYPRVTDRASRSRPGSLRA